VYNSTTRIIICGDFNVDYRVESTKKKKLDNLLQLYNLISIITFPTRVRNKSITSIDNIFIDPSRLEEYSVIPISNGLSDHDPQLLTVRHKIPHDPDSNISTIRKFNNHIIPKFIYQLSNES
jgi:endonuclease/exonuclease/phosphatase family metal-dependent hydrolase